MFNRNEINELTMLLSSFILSTTKRAVARNHKRDDSCAIIIGKYYIRPIGLFVSL